MMHQHLHLLFSIVQLELLELRFGEVAVGQDVANGFEIDGSIETPCFVFLNRFPCRLTTVTR